MIKITGRHNTAICHLSTLDAIAREQIETLCNRVEFSDCKICVMPDAHAGLGCTIGTTMTISDKIVPGMVGVDIGCGIEMVRLAEKEIDFTALDKLIRREIPSGFAIRKNHHPLNQKIDLKELHCARLVNFERARCSIGTLGGGNHFIEIDRADGGALYLVVHSGSRHLGTEVAKHYQDEAYKTLCGGGKRQIEGTIAVLKAEGRSREIAPAIKALKSPSKDGYPQDLAYVSGKLFDDYLDDMKIVQRFAALNRQAMCEIILHGLRLTETDRFTTIHNYIDIKTMILRKGAVSAKRGERLLIPLNMRDGGLICVGKGNDDWNQSAPHGAGRLMSRSQALKTLSMDEYQAGMQSIFTTSVTRRTLDESPMAYRSIDEITSHIESTAEIVARMRPVYNFKAND
ncbi:MAG: RtcB family protein [Desulfobulbaceae bacterium]|nr:RtcB family protein [Desulfobulbaceae bacterium]